MTAIGIDTGGTFTDFVLLEGGGIRVHKVLSTPGEPERAILQGIVELGLDPDGLIVVHGSTVATNAVLESKGVRTLYIGNRGLEDVLAVGRQARSELYDLTPAPRRPPVPPGLCLGTGGRLGADGLSLDPLTEGDLDEIRAAVDRLAPESVAINLLYPFLDASAERSIAQALPDGVFSSLSSEVLPVAGEYERGIATWLNAWVGPVVARYLGRLQAGLPGARISAMQSSGEAIAVERIAPFAVRLLLSGPAGGLAGAGYAARLGGATRILTFDMGGTSTDVAAVAGEPSLTAEGRVAGYPVALPMVDMHTIGAGGGSIARLDAGGLLLVGPESAGADPGPACYGRGGAQATVTDANLVLGRLDPAGFLAGRMALDLEAARRSLAPIAAGLGVGIEEAALGVIRIADEHMARALRSVSVERGLDPRGFVLVPFGGAGGLHVCALAEALDIAQALVPAQAGVLSALGMLVAPVGRTLVRARPGPLDGTSDRELGAALNELAGQAITELKDQGAAAEALVADLSLDLRYAGQSYSLDLPWEGIEATAAAFHRRHELAYGHRLGLPVELVNLRARVRGPAVAPNLSGSIGPALSEPKVARAPGPSRSLVAWDCEGPVPVYARESIADLTVQGPALVVDPVASVWVAQGWRASLDPARNLCLSRSTLTA